MGLAIIYRALRPEGNFLAEERRSRRPAALEESRDPLVGLAFLPATRTLPAQKVAEDAYLRERDPRRIPAQSAIGGFSLERLAGGRASVV